MILPFSGSTEQNLVADYPSEQRVKIAPSGVQIAGEMPTSSAKPDEVDVMFTMPAFGFVGSKSNRNTDLHTHTIGMKQDIVFRRMLMIPSTAIGCRL